MMVRRSLYKELRVKNLASEIEVKMYAYYLFCGVSASSAIYIVRKEPFLFKFIAASLTFSLSFLNLQLFYEEQLYYKLGLQNTETGKIIRERYYKSLPESKAVESFKIAEKKLSDFDSLYRNRENPLKKFEDYIKRHT